MERINVILTWPLWDTLVYNCKSAPPAGSRVLVPLGKSKRVGFVLDKSDKELPDDIKVRDVIEIIDTQRVIDADLWDMALWAGKLCMCGAGEVLNLILPKKFLSGEKVDSYTSPDNYKKMRLGGEVCFYSPLDSERVKFYREELAKPGRVLMMLPSHKRARSFFSSLPENLKHEAILWPSSVAGAGARLWEAWKLAHSKQVRIIVSAPNGIFAPLSPERFIIEDEASPSYIIPYKINISARDLVARRANFLGSEFITGGSLPSLRTFMNSRPKQEVRPDRKNIIIADMNCSFKEESRGIKGTIPLTRSLIKRTYKALANDRNVIWILNRLGDSSEIFCENCGESLRCPKCNNLMRSESEGFIIMLRCRVCGNVINMPDKCGHCGSDFLIGRKPGLEALFNIAKKYFNDVHIYSETSKVQDMHGLILSTNRGLELCSKINPGLIAWLDIDSELSYPDYNTKFNLFTRIWDSYWRGRKQKSDRKILLQARKSGRIFASSFLDGWGWEKFFTGELRIRQEYELPPYGFMFEISCSDKKLREDVINNLDSKGLFVMDPGEGSEKLYVNTKSYESVYEALKSFYSVGKKTKTYPDKILISIRSE